MNRCALERSAQRVFDRDIDFRAIESTVSRVEPPFAGVVFVESVCQLLETSLLGVFANIEYRLANLFGKIPSLDLAKELLWSRGELKGEFEAKHAVDLGQARLPCTPQVHARRLKKWTIQQTPYRVVRYGKIWRQAWLVLVRTCTRGVPLRSP